MEGHVRTANSDYFLSAGAGAAAGAAAGASAAAGAGAAVCGASFCWQPTRTAKNADRTKIFFMSKSPGEYERGHYARRGIIHGRNALPSNNNVKNPVRHSSATKFGETPGDPLAKT